MPIETMTPRERWLTLLQHQKPDRIPMDYWGTPEVTDKLMKHLGTATFKDLVVKLKLDFRVGVGPIYAGPSLPPDTDPFGIRGRNIDYGTGTYYETTYHPLAQFRSVDEIKRNYIWPQADWWYYSQIGKQLTEWEDYPINGGGSEPFLLYCSLRGIEQAMADLVDQADMVHYCMDILFDLAYQNTLRILEAIPGKVLTIYVAEDMGSQSGLMFSPAHIREYLFPGMKRMIDLAHGAGVYVFHHNDGAIMRILPELVDLGIDLLNPIQWKAKGMDRAKLKADYGNRLVFHGGMDNQEILPFGSVDDVRKEVRDNLELLGKGGGYILAPCHNIQPVTPTENILTMYETGYREGWL
jgi:uroporphyrinogen decarboxylase